MKDRLDFTTSGSVEDRAGHGTHVASILAGSGTASGGRYRGVAPDAEIVSGKVLGDVTAQGPVPQTYAIKPDLPAPGIGIAAARATGTSAGTPVDDHYTRLTGTSMATSHVAGAAAILAQQHPGWSGERIKAALITTAKELPGVGVYTQGAGREDVAKATSQ